MTHERRRHGDDTTEETVFYDASCRLCSLAARLVARQGSATGPFRVAPLASEDFERVVARGLREELPDSLVVSDASGRLLTRSTAVAHVLVRLGGAWRFWGRLLLRVPRSLRDLVYDVVARLRRLLPPARRVP